MKTRGSAALLLGFALLLSAGMSRAALAEEASGEFTSRDLAGTYEESGSARIELTGSTANCDSDAVRIDGGVITILDEGTYILSGGLTDGSVVVRADSSDKVQLVLDGASIHSGDSAPVCAIEADKVFITLAEGTENVLSCGDTFADPDGIGIDAAIFAKTDLTLNGSGSLAITVPAGHGVVSKDDLVIAGGSYVIEAASHGLSANDSVRIANASLAITAGKDGIQAENEEDETRGYIYIESGTVAIDAEDDGMNATGALRIAGGEITVACGDDAIHSDAALSISGGKVEITSSYEGLEGLSVEISGGEIALVSSDDGVNAAGGSDQSGFGGFGGRRGGGAFGADADCGIVISGGVLRVDAGGDGLDSNGSLSITGGTIFISGAENSGNEALDYSTGAEITGGTLVAAGSSQMSQGFGASAAQGVISVSTGRQEAGTLVELTDADGHVLISWQAEKAFSLLTLSAPEIVEGAEYTLTVGETEMAIVMDSLTYSSGSASGRAKGGFGGPDAENGGFGGKGGRGGKQR